MREKPDELKSWKSFGESFDPMAFGITEARFQMATETYGDGDSFKWIAGGGEFQYKVTRISRGYSRDDHRPCSKWEVQKFTPDGKLLETCTVDVTTHALSDQEGQTLSQEGIDGLDILLIDLDYEFKARNPTTANLLVPLGHTGLVQLLPNRGFKGVGENEEELYGD